MALSEAHDYVFIPTMDFKWIAVIFFSPHPLLTGTGTMIGSGAIQLPWYGKLPSCPLILSTGLCVPFLQQAPKYHR